MAAGFGIRGPQPLRPAPLRPDEVSHPGRISRLGYRSYQNFATATPKTRSTPRLGALTAVGAGDTGPMGRGHRADGPAGAGPMAGVRGGGT